MLAFPAFPDGIWFYFEVAAEFVTLADLSLRFLLSKYLPDEWAVMSILHV
jgi:hypothetical protein